MSLMLMALVVESFDLGWLGLVGLRVTETCHWGA